MDSPALNLLLTNLIEMVQKAAPALWAIAIKQVIVSGVTYLIGVIIAIVIMIVAIVYLKKALSAAKENIDNRRDPGDANIAFIIGLSGVIIICFIVILTTYPEVVGRLINPEYYAIKLLIDIVTPGG